MSISDLSAHRALRSARAVAEGGSAGRSRWVSSGKARSAWFAIALFVSFGRRGGTLSLVCGHAMTFTTATAKQLRCASVTAHAGLCGCLHSPFVHAHARTHARKHAHVCALCRRLSVWTRPERGGKRCTARYTVVLRGVLAHTWVMACRVTHGTRSLTVYGRSTAGVQSV